jgi:hypothetical protein
VDVLTEICFAVFESLMLCTSKYCFIRSRSDYIYFPYLRDFPFRFVWLISWISYDVSVIFITVVCVCKGRGRVCVF